MKTLQADERLQRPAPAEPWRKEGGGGDDGPARPNVRRPESNDLLKRMKRVDPNQAKRYRQRSGE
ncbi:MAG: ubiquitin-like protein UBact [Armatimonadetes bacterium]|nr:ubiquitin-like protein UBact [Armatimonadota bacterium]